MTLIDVKNLGVLYGSTSKGTLALRNVNFSVNSGEYVCICGSNGAGKSTLIKAILNLVHCSSGRVIFNNNLKKDKISYVPQFCHGFEKIPITVKELVLFGTLKPGIFNLFYHKKDKIIAFEYLEKLNLKEMLDCKVSELSGGQIRKALLCRALCSEPKVLILDEPCANLDEESSIKFYEILKKLNKEKNITVIMVLHDLIKAKQFATKIINLEKGRIISCVNKI